jgi:hypothetical protein
MTLILSGTDGLSDIDGSAAAPAIRGTDANTGIFFGTDIIGFSEGGVEAMRINASGNVEVVGTLTTSSRGIAKASMPAGSVLQVVSTTKTDSFSTSATSMTDVTGLSVSITPTASTSKILVLLTLNLAGANGNAGASYQLVRGSTAIAIGDVAGSRPQASGSIAYIADANSSTALSGSFLDSPATTSSTTYKIQVVPGGAPGAGNAYVNRTQNDTNGTNFYNARTASTITVMEIAA